MTGTNFALGPKNETFRRPARRFRRRVFRAFAALLALVALAIALVLIAVHNIDRPWLKGHLLAFAKTAASTDIDFGAIEIHELSGPSLAPFRALTIDRAALTNLSAGRFDRALALYDRELAIAADENAAGTRRNRVVLRLAHAAAAIGAKDGKRALGDLDVVDRAHGGARR